VKLDRAREHLEELAAEVRKWIEPYTTGDRIHLGHDGTWYILFSPAGGVLPSARVSAIAGDFVQNLRAALDYMVCQLVVREGKSPNDRNEFPILESASRFRDEVKLAKRREKTGLYGIPVDGDAWKVIEQAQPFNRVPVGPTGDPLATPYGSPIAILRRLSNADKHQTLLFQLPIPEGSTLLTAVGWSDSVRLAEHRIAGLPISIETPTEILRLRFEPAGRDPGMYVKGKISLNPTFGELGVKPMPDGFIYGTQVTVGAGTTSLVQTVLDVAEAIAALPNVVGW